MGLGAASLAAARASATTLREAWSAALSRNLELAEARLDIERADADSEQAEAPFDLHLEANWAVDQTFAPVFVTGLGQLQLLRLRDLTFDQSIIKRLSTGTEIGLEFLSLGSSIDGGAQGDVSIARESVQLRVLQPLLRGRSTGANRSALEAAAQRRTAATAEQQARAADLLAQVEMTYWELAYAQRETEILQLTLETSRKLLEDAKRRVRIGHVAPADLLVVEHAVAQAADELVASDGRRRNRAIELARLTALDPGGLRATEWPRVPALMRPEVVLQTIHASPMARELQALRLSSEADALGTSDQGLPRIDLVGSAGPLGQRTSVGAALSAMAAFDQVTWSVGMQVSWAPAGNGQRGASRRAAIDGRRAMLEQAKALRDAEQRARTLLVALEGASRRLELARSASEIGKRALAAEQIRFEAGVVPAKYVLDRQVELAQAMLRQARVEVDAALARAALDGLMGQNGKGEATR